MAAAAPTEDALLACLRWDETGGDLLRSLDAGQWDRLWRMVEAGAGQHFLARRLQISDVKPPVEIAHALRAHTMAVAARNLVRRTVVTAAIGATGRPALLLKGIDLATRLYVNPGLRPMGDVDLLVHPEDVAAFDAHLRAAGYMAQTAFDDAILNSARHHNLDYLMPESMARVVELHWRLADEQEDRHIDLQDIWRRAIPRPDIAAGAYVMAPEDLFLHLCLHLKHHTFETSLTQIWDLAEILGSGRLPLSWPVVWSRAKEWRLTETLRIALYLVAATLGVPTRQISDWIPPSSLAAQLPDALANLGRFPIADQVNGHRVTILLSAQSTWRERLRVFREGVVPPRREIRAAYGRPDDEFLADCRSYLRRWQGLLRSKGGLLMNWVGGDAAVTSHIDRVAALRRHLDKN